MIVGLAASSASAVDEAHYYGVAYLQGNAFYGTYGNVDFDNIGINYQNDHANGEIWTSALHPDGNCDTSVGSKSDEAGSIPGEGGA